MLIDWCSDKNVRAGLFLFRRHDLPKKIQQQQKRRGKVLSPQMRIRFKKNILAKYHFPFFI
jgi:hypothetical protein